MNNGIIHYTNFYRHVTESKRDVRRIIITNHTKTMGYIDKRIIQRLHLIPTTFKMMMVNIFSGNQPPVFGRFPFSLKWADQQGKAISLETCKEGRHLIMKICN